MNNIQFIYFSLFTMILFFHCNFIFSIPTKPAPGKLLELSIGAKAFSYGLSYSSIVSDPSALYWNPAGLANIKGSLKLRNQDKINAIINQEFQASKKSLPTNVLDQLQGVLRNNEKDKENSKKSESSIKNTYYGLSFHIYNTASLFTFDREGGFLDKNLLFFTAIAFNTPIGSWAIGVQGIRTPEILHFDTNGSLDKKINYFSLAEYIGYAYSIEANLKIGFSIVAIQEQIDDNKYIYGGSLSVGLQIEPINYVSIGIYAKNLAGVLQNSATDKNSLDKLDTILDVDVNIHSIPLISELLITTGLSLNLDEIQDPSFVIPKLGVSYKIASLVILALGINRRFYSIGIGFEHRYFRIHYSVYQNFFKYTSISTCNRNKY